MNLVYLTVSLCCSVLTIQASQPPIPSSLTKVEYYTNVFSWNEAYDICNRSGGSLLQPETLLEWHYYQSVIRELSVMTKRDKFEVWLGMILVYPGKPSVVWVDGCLPVCHNHYPAGEPNHLFTDLCFRVEYQREETTSDIFEWRTTPCDNNGIEIGFICTQDMGMPCDYQEHRNTKLTITPDSAQSEVLNTSQTVCSRLCASRIRHHLECWALTYNKDRGECTLYYLRDPFFLTKTETTKDRHCITMTKECFHLEIRSDVQPSQHGNEIPSSPCFESPVSTTCPAKSTHPHTKDFTSTHPSAAVWSLNVTSSQSEVPNNNRSVTRKSKTDMTSVSMVSEGLPTGSSDVSTTTDVSSATIGAGHKQTTSEIILRSPMLPLSTSTKDTRQTATSTAKTDTSRTSTETAAPMVTTETFGTSAPTTKTDTGTATTAETDTTTAVTAETDTMTAATTNTDTPTATTTETDATAATTLGRDTTKATTEVTDITTATTTETETMTAATEVTDITAGTTKTTEASASTSVATALPLQRNSSSQICFCPCVRLPVVQDDITKAKFTRNLVAKLEINKTSLSSTRRKLISVYESRVLPVALGTFGLGILLTVYGAILLSDIVPHLRKLTVQATDNKHQSSLAVIHQ